MASRANVLLLLSVNIHRFSQLQIINKRFYSQRLCPDNRNLGYSIEFYLKSQLSLFSINLITGSHHVSKESFIGAL